MKKILALSILFALATGCSIEKRKYNSGYFVQKSWKKNSAAKTSGVLAEKTRSKKNMAAVVSEPTPPSYQAYTQPTEIASANPIPKESFFSPYKEVKTFSTDSCDLLILKSGEEVYVKTLEITDKAIKYIRCDNLLGPIYNVEKEKVFMLKYANGTKEVIKTPEKSATNSGPSQNYAPSESVKRKVQGLALWGFIVALVGWFLPAVGLAILMEAVGLVLGVSGLTKIKKQPEKYRGKGFAIAAIVLAVIGIIILITLI